ncbi:MAG TPA: Yip1 family protein [Methylophilaceae bacterium]
MNPIRLIRYATDNAWESMEKKPSVMQMVWMYVVPLSLVPSVVLYLVVRTYPKLFMDILPGDRVMLVSMELFVGQIVSILMMAWISRNLAEMVNLKPSFRDSLLVIATSVTPFWLVSVFYLIPSIPFNLVMHGIATLASITLVYYGVNNIFGLKRRGAAAMLAGAIVCTAALGFAVLLVCTLISWNDIQHLQFSLK